MGITRAGLVLVGLEQVLSLNILAQQTILLRRKKKKLLSQLVKMTSLEHSLRVDLVCLGQLLPVKVRVTSV